MKKLHWLDVAKALAILGILLNHLVEEFGVGPWFTNPSEDWPDFHTRMQHIFPADSSFIVAFIRFLGWLGDSGPGVFIILSGIGLTMSALRNEKHFSTIGFYRKRLLRIFPLYIAIHFIIMIGLILKDGGSFPISFNTFLSILGLRFTDNLFFYLNPSWWFIWLIIQLYIVFPLLYRLFEKAGWQKFLVVTFLFTFLVRGAGLFDIHYSKSIYFWMTGIFFGTRLAEFSLGMVLGYFLLQIQKGSIQIPRINRVFIFSIVIYIAGFIASFSYAGSIVSNLLVSAGLTGIFYCIWEGFLKNMHPRLGKILIWFGINSYVLYLIHQPPLQWINYKFDGKEQLLLSLGWLAGSVVLSWFINQMVENRSFMRLKIFSWKSMSILAVLVLILIFTEGIYERSHLFQRIYLLFLCSAFLLQAWYLYRWFDNKFLETKDLLIYTSILVLFLRLFILPDYHAYFSVITSLSLLILFFLLKLFIKSKLVSLLLAGGIMIIGFIYFEKNIRNNIPMEVGGAWGELPVLKKDSTRIYALKPDQNKILRYNNYDFRVTTNSYGLPGPDISFERLDSSEKRILIVGDAFTMPEGLDYESSYPYLLKRIIENDTSGTEVQIINGGVTGYGPVEAKATMEELAALYIPDIIIYQFFVNEFEEVLMPAQTRLEYIGLTPRELPQITRMANRSHLIEYLNRKRAYCIEYLTGRPAGWRYAKTLLGYYERDENIFYDDVHLDTLCFYIEQMKIIAENIESEIMVVYVPAAVAVTAQNDMSYLPWNIDVTDTSRFDYEKPVIELRKIAKNLQIPVYDLSTVLKNHFSQPVYYKASWHWNEEGHKAAAIEIARILKEDYINVLKKR